MYGDLIRCHRKDLLRLGLPSSVLSPTSVLIRQIHKSSWRSCDVMTGYRDQPVVIDQT